MPKEAATSKRGTTKKSVDHPTSDVEENSTKKVKKEPDLQSILEEKKDSCNAMVRKGE